MPTSLRLVILAGALLIITMVLGYIRKKRILMADSTGWVCIALLLLLIAIFPGLVTHLAARLGFQSPANFVFFVVTGLLVVKTFHDTARISTLTHKLEELTQELALQRADDQDDATHSFHSYE